MSFTENLRVEIESLLDAKGFKQLEKNIAKAKAEMQTINKAFSNADGLRSFRENVQQEAGKVRQEAQDMGRVLDEAGLQEAPESLSAPFLDPRQGDNLFSQQVGMDEAEQRILNAQDRIRNNRMGAGQIFSDGGGSGVRMTGGGAPNMALQQAQNIDTPNPRKFGVLRRVLFRVASSSRFASANMTRLSAATSRASAGFTALTGRVMGATSAIRAQIPSLQQLQMQLLGVQFSLMSLAFIFGGLMAGALGAVGVFSILGSTLKMFFLPAALSLLPVVMDIRDALLGIDEDTRKSIGRIFMIIAAIGALGSIMAFTMSGILGFLQGITMLGKIVYAVAQGIGYLIPTMQTLSAAAGVVKTAFGIVTASLGAALAFLGGLAAGFFSVILVAKKFGKIVALIFGSLVAVIAGYAATLVATMTAPFWAVPALIGLALGAVMGLIWTFRDEIVGAFQWIVKKIVGVFKWLYNVLVGNSIIPDMVSDIVSTLMSIPGKIVNLGKNIVNTIVNGITSMAGAIWNAFKSIMPDFVVDAIENTGQAIGGIVNSAGKVIGKGGDILGDVAGGIGNAVGGLASGAVNAAGDFASGVGNTVNNLNPLGGDGNNGGGGNVQNNNINAQVNIQDSRETPEETGRKFGEGLSQGLNNQTSNISSGT